MDGNHKLDAPNNDALSTIDQIADRSDITTVYRAAGKQFEGEILSAEDRAKAKEQKIDAITLGLWKSSFKIGFFVVYPFIAAALSAVLLYLNTSGLNPLILTPLLIVIGGVWLITSYNAYRAIYRIFYKHALRATPFLFVMLINVFLASFAFYSYVVDHLATQSLLFNVGFISLLTLAYSIITSYIILLTWGAPRISSSLKAFVAGGVLAISGFLVALTYLI